MDNISLEELEAALGVSGAPKQPDVFKHLPNVVDSVSSTTYNTGKEVGGALFGEVYDAVKPKGSEPVTEQKIQAAATHYTAPGKEPVDMSALLGALDAVSPTKNSSSQNSVQTTRDPATAAKEAMELQTLFTEHSRNRFMTADGIDMQRKHEEAALKAIKASENLKNERAKSPLATWFLGDEIHVTARAELDAALQEELTLRNYLQGVNAARGDSLQLIDSFVRQQVKSSVNSASGDPTSELHKKLKKDIAEAAVKAWDTNVSKVKPTTENINLITDGFFAWNSGQPNELMDGGLGQAIETILAQSNPVADIDLTRPFSSMSEKIAAETPGTVNYNKLLAHRAFVQTAFMNNMSESDKKSFELLKPEDKAAKLDTYATTLYNAYKEQGLPAVINSGLQVPIQDAGALLMEQFKKYGLPEDDFLVQYVKDKKVASVDKVPQWNSELLESARLNIKSRNKAEQIKAANQYAEMIAESFRTQRNLIDKSKSLFFSLHDKEYKFPVQSRAFKHGMFALSGTFPIDFTNSAQISAFLLADDHK